MLKRGREELPHVRGQGQKPGGPHDRQVAAKRSYPAFEVRGGDERSYPASEVRGGDREEIPQERGQGRWPRGDTPQTRPGAVARKTGPMSKERWLHGCRSVCVHMCARVCVSCSVVSDSM